MLENTFFWVYISGAALGCSLGFLRKRAAKKKSGTAGFALLLSISLLAFSAGIVFSSGFLSAPALFALPFTGSAATGFLIGRFPLAVLPPVAVLLSLLYVLVYLQIQSEPGIPVHTNELRVSVLRISDTGGVLEISWQGKAELLKLQSNRFYLNAELIVLSPYLPWPRQDYIFAHQLVQESGAVLTLPDFREKPGMKLPLLLSDPIFDLRILQKETRSAGPFFMHLLRSYSIDYASFVSGQGSLK
ncbi:hypothetical protein [Marispirochaeta sp.]|uniref:hypothetical protein n=1 Tax=Marispirochaeta sp. TaxID=2038653 RepID=UPI0029C62C49|nr:hypothetical protein [Marispirochaeta sp.]